MNDQEKAAEAAPPATPLADMKTVDAFYGHVVQPGANPRVHGYSVHDDLAVHYSHDECVLLALTGELPSVSDAKAFSVARNFLMDTPVTCAPTHAARVCLAGKGGTSSVASVGVLALIGKCEEDLASFGAVTSWETGLPVPPELRPVDGDERMAVARLRSALPWSDLGMLANDIGLMPAILAVFVRCGIERREMALIALLQGRLATTLAEGFGSGDRTFAALPARVPEMKYVPEVKR